MGSKNMTNGHPYIKTLIEKLLRDPTPDLEWTVQGFGMVRTYVGPPSNPKQFRLNIWDRGLAVPNVSTIHDHPWDFESHIVAGVFVNQRFAVLPLSEYGRPTHSFTEIKCGMGGGMESSPVRTVGLRAGRPELYEAGDTYRQKADEVHDSIPAIGSVTINERVGDTERARVFWPIGTDWVSAEPRVATPDEVARSIASALEWF
jgi:hypothetical protein